MKIKIYVLLFTLLVGVIQSCDDDNESSVPDEKKQAIEVYAKIVLASYEDSYSTATTLKEKINAFIAAPSATLYEDCKTAWKNARIVYGQTEAYRFYGGPIDDEDGPEGLINAWPMDENFMDYTADNPDAGLINDPTAYPVISKSVLEDLNESISETSIFTGYHAIEFLLWGQDLSTSGPGARPYTDYVSGAGGTAANQQRRGQYLNVVADLLLDHLALVRDEWKAGGAYRTDFLRTDTDEVLGRIFTGLGELSKGELSGERMFVAVDTQDQENEHSCFSDNTHVDIEMNFKGIKNVYYGTYTRTDGTTVSGKSFSEIAIQLNPTKSAVVDAAFADAEAKINAIPVPFDQAISNSPNVVLTAVGALSDLSDTLSDVAFLLDATL
jgi:putative iron-regulated protein